MSDYLEQINQISEELHSPVIDNDEAIIVNVEERTFTVGKIRRIGIVGDKNSEIVSFRIDRYIEGHNISECSEYKVFWRHETTKKEGYHTIDIVKVSEDEDVVFLGWKIDDNVTETAGEIAFALKISDYDSDGECIYEFNTKEGSGLFVEPGFKSSNGGTDPLSGKGIVISDTRPSGTNVLWFNTSV